MLQWLENIRQRLLGNPTIVRAGYDEIVGDKGAAITAYEEMIRDQTIRSETKRDELKRLTSSIADLQKHSQGAKLMAQEIVNRKKAEIEELLTKGDITHEEAESRLAEIENDEEFNYCWDHYTRTSQSLEEKQRLIPQLREEIEDLDKKILQHEQRLSILKMEKGDLEGEREDAVANAKRKREVEETDHTHTLANLRGLDEKDKTTFIAQATEARATFKKETGIPGLTVVEQKLEEESE